MSEIDYLNSSQDIDGILVQLPVPDHIDERRVCDAVTPHKDVDGFNVLNVGRFCVDERAFIPATPSGVLEIIKRLSMLFLQILVDYRRLFCCLKLYICHTAVMSISFHALFTLAGVGPILDDRLKENILKP